MRVRYSFSSRRTGNIENIAKQREKYPNITKELVNNSDILLEVLDSRFPQETRNLEIEKIIKEKGKILIYILNKADLGEENKIKKKVSELGIYPFVIVSCRLRRGVSDLRERIKIEAKKIIKTKGDKISVGVIGYPNTGKSSLINVLMGRASAKTAAKPGTTKGIQKIKLTKNILLIDNPGVIPEKQYSNIRQNLITKQVKLGARAYYDVKNPEIVVAELIKEYPGLLEKFYNINAKGDSELLIEELGRKKNLLRKGNLIDVDRTSRLILKDWQEGRIKA